MENKHETTSEKSPQSYNDLNRPLRVYGYVRVANTRQLDGLSEKQQRNLIEKVVSRMPNADLIEIYSDVDIPYRSLHCHHGALRLSKKCRDGEADLVLAATPISTTRFINSAMAYTILLKYMAAPVQFTNGAFNLKAVPDRPWVSLIDTPDSVLQEELLLGMRG